MKKFNKIILLALSAAMFLSTLTSCKFFDGTWGADEENPPVADTLPEDTYAAMDQGIDYSSEIGNVADYAVVVSDLATASEKYAAEELVSFVKEITGTELPYASDGEYEDSKVISVGETSFLTSSGIELDKSALGSDGFILKNKGNAILICGGSDRGTIYGVYDFLEYHLGVKFLTSDYTYIPSADDAKVYACDRTETPAFEYRVLLDYNAFSNESPEFNVRSRFTSEYLTIPDNMGGNIKWFQDRPTHNSLFWAQVEKYVKDGKIADEYLHAFANDGKNLVEIATGGGEFTNYATDLCYTDGINEDGSVSLVHENGTPTAIAMVIEGMKEVIRNDKGENNYYMFGQNDYASRPCLCERCVAANKEYTDAGMMIRFVNALADAIEAFRIEEGIERKIEIITFAYSWTAYAPTVKNDDGSIEAIDPTCIPRENIVVRLAPIGCNHFVAYEHDAQNSTNYGSEYMDEWAAICDNFMIWDYTTYYSRWYYFYPTMPSWHDKLVTSRDMGVKYIMYQSTHQEKTIYQTVLERYVASKMFWNPDYDINEIISEFHKYYLGDIAAPYVDEYVQLMTAKCYDHLESKEYTATEGLKYFDKAFLNNVIALLDEAMAAIEASELTAAEKEMYIARVELVQFQPRYMYLYNYMQYESDDVAMKIYAKEVISDILAAGGMWCIEGKMFDLENLVFSK